MILPGMTFDEFLLFLGEIKKNFCTLRQQRRFFNWFCFKYTLRIYGFLTLVIISFIQSEKTQKSYPRARGQLFCVYEELK